jgi:hypothetical protein
MLTELLSSVRVFGMKTKILKGSPVLQPVITEKNYEHAVTAASGGCLVADAIKEQYPQLSHVEVDVATIRVTDRERGERYIYLTPQSVAEALLAFDQGWKDEELPRQFLIRKAVKIIPVTRSASSKKKTAEDRQQRLFELEAKVKTGKELSPHEKTTLTKLSKPKESPERPTTYGPSEIEASGSSIVVKGGVPPKTAKQNPNLLHGRNRHFGAKTAKPSEVFEKAVKEAIKADRKKRKKQKSE